MIFKKRTFGLADDETEISPTLTLASRSLTGQTTGTGLCSIGTLQRACYVNCAVELEINILDTVYNSDATIFAGNNKYFLLALAVGDITYNVKIDNSGTITALTSC